jgi:hypothetical protein
MGNSKDTRGRNSFLGVVLVYIGLRKAEPDIVTQQDDNLTLGQEIHGKFNSVGVSESSRKR